MDNDQTIIRHINVHLPISTSINFMGRKNYQSILRADPESIMKIIRRIKLLLHSTVGNY